MVGPQIGVILVCSWEEVSSGSFYSAILASLPFTIFLPTVLKHWLEYQRKYSDGLPGSCLRGREYAEDCTQHSARHGEQEGKVFVFVLISSCKGLTLASRNTLGCSRTETWTCLWEILTCIHLMIASLKRKKHLSSTSPPFPVLSGLWKSLGCSWRIEKSSRVGVRVRVRYAQSWLLLWDPMDCSPPGSSVHEVCQAIEWAAISSSGDLPDPGIEPKSPALAGGFFTTSAKTGGSCLIYYKLLCYWN